MNVPFGAPRQIFPRESISPLSLRLRTHCPLPIEGTRELFRIYPNPKRLVRTMLDQWFLGQGTGPCRIPELLPQVDRRTKARKHKQGGPNRYRGALVGVE